LLWTYSVLSSCSRLAHGWLSAPSEKTIVGACCTGSGRLAACRRASIRTSSTEDSGGNGIANAGNSWGTPCRMWATSNRISCRLRLSIMGPLYGFGTGATSGRFRESSASPLRSRSPKSAKAAVCMVGVQGAAARLLRSKQRFQGATTQGLRAPLPRSRNLTQLVRFQTSDMRLWRTQSKLRDNGGTLPDSQAIPPHSRSSL
jgi:hypothetical protein